MKKALVVLLILAVAGGAFAQITWTGDVMGGMGVLITDKKDSDPSLGNYRAGDNFTARVNVTGNYVSPEGTAGARIILRGQADRDKANMSTPGVFPTVYEAWFKMLNNMITVYGGKLDSGGNYGTGGGVDTSFDIGAGEGMFIDVVPFSGLGIRAGVYPSFLVDEKTFGEARYNFGVYYQIDDFIKVAANLVQGRNSDGVNRWERTDAAVGVNLFLLRPLINNINIDAAFLNLQQAQGTNGKYMTIQIGEKVDLAMGDLGAGIRFQQQFRMYDGNTPNGIGPDLSFLAYLQYALMNNTIVPRLDAGFNLGTGLRQEVNEIRPNWDGLNRSGFSDKGSNLVIGPSAEFRFAGASNRNIKIGYTLQMDLSDGAEATAERKTMNNLIYVDYRVSF